MKSKTLWIRLLSAVVVLCSVITLSACAADEGAESGSGSGSGSGSDSTNTTVNNGPRAEDYPASANLDFTLIKGKGYQLKSASKCKDERIVIPATYAGTDGVPQPVVSIASNALKGNKTATSVYIPDSVTSIGKNAFTGATALKMVVFGSGLTEIGSNAFENCKQLVTVYFKEGLTKIGEYAFAGCVNLSKVVFPESLKTIGESAFQRCSRLTSVTFGKSLTKIGDFALYFCKNISEINYTGTTKDWKKVSADAKVFLSVTNTKVIKCADGTAPIPNIEGNNTLPD